MKIARKSTGEMTFKEAPNAAVFQFTETENDTVYIKVAYEGQDTSAVCLDTGRSYAFRQNGGYDERVRIFPNATLLLHGENKE